MFDKRVNVFYNNTRVIARCTMQFSVKSILNVPGGELPFSFSMILSDVELGGQFPVTKPVAVEGTVRNIAGVLDLELTARTTLSCVCDRCAGKFLREKEISYGCILANDRQCEENDEIVLLKDGEFVDVEDLARTAFILGMDTKILCSEDCKGLCPRCGADLNLGPCSCKVKEVDPRLAVLATLLKNNDNE